MDAEAKRAYQRAWYQANKARLQERHRQRYEVNKDEILSQQAKRRAENPEAVKQARRKYYLENRAALLERSRSKHVAKRQGHLQRLAAYRSRPEYAAEQAERRAAWKATHRSEVREYEAFRRARKAGLEAERIVRDEVWRRDNGVCRICGRQADSNDWHLEHIVPLALGGPHKYTNVAVSCPDCNLMKGVADPRLPGSPYAYLLDGGLGLPELSA